LPDSPSAFVKPPNLFSPASISGVNGAAKPQISKNAGTPERRNAGPPERPAAWIFELNR